MKVKQLKKILETFDEAADVFITKLGDINEKFNIEIISKDENVFYKGYCKYSSMNIMITPIRKRG